MFVFTYKQYTESFAILNVRIIELFTREDRKFLKK